MIRSAAGFKGVAVLVLLLLVCAGAFGLDGCRPTESASPAGTPVAGSPPATSTGRAGRPAATSTSPGAAPKTFACKGKVVDQDDNPLAGVTLTAYVEAEREFLDQPMLFVPAASTVSAADGSFVLTGRRPTDLVLVVARVTDGRKLGVNWRLYSGGSQTLRLLPEVPLAGQVVDEQNAPIGGAKVYAVLHSVDRGYGWRLEGEEGIDFLGVTTGADGRFAFPGVPEGCEAEFAVTAKGKARFDSRGRGAGAVTPRTDIRLTLAPEARVEVRAINKATSQPVGNVPLVILPMRDGYSAHGACTDSAGGRYVFEGLLPGQYRVHVASPRQGTAEWAAVPSFVDLKPGLTATAAALELEKGGLARITVRDADTGLPIVGGEIDTYSQRRRGGQVGSFGLTDEAGVASVRLLPGEYRIATYINGYGRPDRDVHVTVEEGKTATAELMLKRSPLVHGKVTDPAGAVVPDALLCLLGDREYTAAASDGGFELARQPEYWGGRRSSLVVARSPKTGLAGAVSVPDPLKAADIKLQPGWSVSGRVLDSQGKPLAKAAVSAVMEMSYAEALPALGKGSTDAAGHFEIAALPPGRTYALRVTARGHCVLDLPLDFAGSSRLENLEVRLRDAGKKLQPPTVKMIDIPEIPGSWAIWGATGRDQRGHIWFSVTAHEIEQPSAHLFELDVATGKVADRGDIVSELKRAGVYRAGDGQMKIHSKLYEASDGYLYFASMDEEGEDESKEINPKYGSHLWRLKLSDNKWEHLLAVPEGLVAVGLSGRYVYALGYWQHVLYQYDIQTGKSRSVKIGAIGGHISRNILTDARGHVYLPRVTGTIAEPAATLVELDESLKELAQTPLRYYFDRSPSNSHGITGLSTMPDGSIIFMTSNGWLSRVQPSADGPAKVTDIGWFHPAGWTYCASLFADGDRYLMGAVTRGYRGGGYEWVVHDLKDGWTSAVPMVVNQPKDFSLSGALLYGSWTRDDAGSCYVVGGGHAGFGQPMGPVCLQVKPNLP